MSIKMLSESFQKFYINKIDIDRTLSDIISIKHKLKLSIPVKFKKVGC